MSSARQLAFIALRQIMYHKAFTDIALDRVLHKSGLKGSDRGFVAELVYGTVRRQKTLDAIINQFGSKPIEQQPPDLRVLLQLGLYQIRYLDSIPPSAAVNTTVDLAKENRLGKLAGVVNGCLRQYLRSQEKNGDPLVLPGSQPQRFALQYSFPEWLIATWLGQFGEEETAQLCEWFNQPATLDIRINPLKQSLEHVQVLFANAGVKCEAIADLPNALRLTEKRGMIQNLPGYKEGWWTIQDASAQLVSHLLDPQPKEVIIDACAAPGGKTTHIAELMGDEGTIWASDKYQSRINKIEQNARRLDLMMIRTLIGDSREYPQFRQMADRVLLDVPCSGLGTLHKRPDIRWQQNPDKISELTQLQSELLQAGSKWVKPNGCLVYSTCTINPAENAAIAAKFLEENPEWQIVKPEESSPAYSFASEEGWIEVLPHKHDMDGFFMVKFQKTVNSEQ
ncbi:16S rRNA (cytosine(967)-C(5))-methyltransferase [[Limnothrix rosea] IAM M-220]|uniref:16S rRNA (cytosine(967)-C(5))-methyltransferase n=1 Tax=[Limnothrix rosea] IAM M-220 TaxID=454133 RepID=UPI000959478A|nr:16S rRNA (cytosine(967)-C(5))-methyltransferase [[Limnothrix rosea] IAM M-220]OKH13793.1 16S rRNA (cytosine(967)-C(5))-methyltransferase [[Limnothrix rosea] IAM M-220]